MGLIDRLDALDAENEPDPPPPPARTPPSSPPAPGVPGQPDRRKVPSPPAPAVARPTGETKPGAPATGSPLPPGLRERRGKDRLPNSEWDDMKEAVVASVRQDLAPIFSTLSPQNVEQEVKSAVEKAVENERFNISPIQRRAFVQQVISDVLGYGPLDPLLADSDITEIMCNRHNEIWVERNGVIEVSSTAFSSEEQYRAIIQRIVNGVGRRVDESSPMVDARTGDGSRVNVIVPPLALDGAVLTIRKFPSDPLTADELLERGVYTQQFVDLISAAVRARLNILISGGTGSGKTTTLNVLSSFIPSKDRVVTIEDSAELQLQQPHVVRLESRPSNSEGHGEVAIRDLVRNSLRMRPDRILIGECRGGEALDMLQAMNTGHNGSLATLHANSARDAIKRLETMVLMAGFELPLLAIKDQIASALHLVVQVSRLPTGQRIIEGVSEIQGMDGGAILIQDIMTHQGGPEGALVPTGLRPRLADAIEAYDGPLPDGIFMPGGYGAHPTRDDRSDISIPKVAIEDFDDPSAPLPVPTIKSASEMAPPPDSPPPPPPPPPKGWKRLGRNDGQNGHGAP